MKFVIRPRQGGKTFEAVKWLQANPGGVLLVHSEEYASALRKEHGFSEKQVMSFRSAQTRLRGRRKTRIAIDNVDLMLAYLLGTGPFEIDLVTATGESA